MAVRSAAELPRDPANGQGHDRVGLKGRCDPEASQTRGQTHVVDTSVATDRPRGVNGQAWNSPALVDRLSTEAGEFQRMPGMTVLDDALEGCPVTPS